MAPLAREVERRSGQRRQRKVRCSLNGMARGPAWLRYRSPRNAVRGCAGTAGTDIRAALDQSANAEQQQKGYDQYEAMCQQAAPVRVWNLWRSSVLAPRSICRRGNTR